MNPFAAAAFWVNLTAAAAVILLVVLAAALANVLFRTTDASLNAPETPLSVVAHCADRVVCYRGDLASWTYSCFRDADLIATYCPETNSTLTGDKLLALSEIYKQYSQTAATTP